MNKEVVACIHTHTILLSLRKCETLQFNIVKKNKNKETNHVLHITSTNLIPEYTRSNSRSLLFCDPKKGGRYCQQNWSWEETMKQWRQNFRHINLRYQTCNLITWGLITQSYATHLSKIKILILVRCSHQGNPQLVYHFSQLWHYIPGIRSSPIW